MSNLSKFILLSLFFVARTIIPGAENCNDFESRQSEFHDDKLNMITSGLLFSQDICKKCFNKREMKDTDCAIAHRYLQFYLKKINPQELSSKKITISNSILHLDAENFESWLPLDKRELDCIVNGQLKSLESEITKEVTIANIEKLYWVLFNKKFEKENRELKDKIVNELYSNANKRKVAMIEACKNLVPENTTKQTMGESQEKPA